MNDMDFLLRYIQNPLIKKHLRFTLTAQIDTLYQIYIFGPRQLCQLTARRLEGAVLALTFEFPGYAFKTRLSSGLNVLRKVICSCDCGWITMSVPFWCRIKVVDDPDHLI